MPKAAPNAGNKAERKKALLRLLRDVRKEAGLTQVQLAEKLGVPQSFVSKYESGERRLDLLDLERVCKGLGIAMVQLVSRFEQSTK